MGRLWSRNRVTLQSLVRLRKERPHSVWHQKGFPEGTVSQRIKMKDYVLAEVEPKFKIRPGERVFAMGSCFARNIEEHLVRHDVVVPSMDIHVDDEYYRPENHRHNAVLNLYSTNSILSTVECARRGQFDFVNVGEDRYALPNASFLDPMPLGAVKGVSRSLVDCYAGAAGSDVVVITLGQNECWFDNETGLYWNQMPPNELIRSAGDRFDVYCPDYDENREALAKVIAAFEGKRIVLTVSPVPLTVTFSGEDALMANLYNKSVLRACAGEFAAANDNVQYFPSYEMVTSSPRRLAYEPDARHVKDEMVEQVIGLFVSKFLVRN